MVSFSNGSLSCEVSNKRSLGNGCVFKYKPREVSAVRNFPPGCGPKALPTNLRSEGKCGSDMGCSDAQPVTSLETTNNVVVNGAETSVMADLVEFEAVGNTKIAKLADIEDSEIQNVVDPKANVECQSPDGVGSSSALTLGAGVNGSVGVPKVGTLDKLMGKIKENITESKKLVMEIRPFGTPLQEEAAGHTQEEVNHNIEIASDEAVDACIRKVIKTVMNGRQNGVQDVMPELDLVNKEILNECGGQTMSEVFKEDTCLAYLQNSGVEVTRCSSNADAPNDKDLLLGNHLEFPAHCGSTHAETSIRPKDKYRPRTVSAVRKFPPNCGTNASLPIEKEKQNSTPGKDSQNSLDGLQNIHVESEENEMLNDGAGGGSAVHKLPPYYGANASLPTEKEKEMCTPGKDSQNSLDGLQNIHVESEENEMLNDGAGSGSAVHKLPPYYGANASLPTEKEKEMCTPGKDSRNSLDGLHNIRVEIEENELLDDGAGRGLLREMTVATAEGETMESEEQSGDLLHSISERTGSGTMSTAMVNTSIEDAGEPIGKEIALISPDGNDKGRLPYTDTSSGSDFKKEIVHGLTAVPYCSRQKSKASRKNPDDGTGDLEMRDQKRQEPKTDALNNNFETNPSGCSSPKKTASHDSHDGDETPDKSTFVDEGVHRASSLYIPEVTPISMFKADGESSDNDVSKNFIGSSPGDSNEGSDFKKELVHCLMAAPYYSRRKSKAANGGTGDMKKRQQNKPQRQKPETDSFNSNFEANPSGYSSLKKTANGDFSGDEIPGKSPFLAEGNHCASSECILDATPISMFKAEDDGCDNDYAEPFVKDIVVCSPRDSDGGRNSRNAFGSKDDMDQEVLHDSMTEREKVKTVTDSNGGTSRGKKRRQNLSWRQKAKAVAKKSNLVQCSGSSSKKKKKVNVSNDVDEGTHDSVRPNVEDDDHAEDLATNSLATNKETDLEVSLPRFGPMRSGLGDARNKVRGVLQLFHTKYRKLLQQEEADPVQGMEGRSEQSSKKFIRHDLMVAQVLKDKGEFVNSDKMIGPVPGVEVGDEFQYRVELAIVGIHFPYQSGIDSVKVNDVPLATSIVTSGAYFDDVKNADVLIYSGQGGNVIGKSKEPEDQKMERGNLALKNSIEKKTPVRVVRGWKEKKIVDPQDVKPKFVTTYVYDGLYTVTNYWTEKGPRGKQVFKFELKRNPGQPELAWKELKSNKSKIRPGVCVTDISGGKERIPISAVNTLDDDKPPPFNYTPKMIYPDWYSPIPPEGCSCTGRCSKSKKCRCAARNEGEISYNHNGALVETKPLVYECGPHCKCPPSCYNRVTQRGIKFQLEIFKTESRGWGVRALTSIPSGSFICEYAGELLEEKIADERIGSDEYLFDIGQNLIDEQAVSAEPGLGKGYTIDALKYGNVGRFINHSCLPNLHAQNVIYDNDDKGMPHIMLFAMENIPPLTELTYHYNYSLGQVYDSDGNVKVKKCYCGAVGCSGRMY